jgi:hypothetical protein
MSPDARIQPTIMAFVIPLYRALAPMTHLSAMEVTYEMWAANRHGEITARGRAMVVYRHRLREVQQGDFGRGVESHRRPGNADAAADI